jgi:hypothetical protein
MNVKDLIEKLKTFPAGTQVLVQGYEGGYDDIARIDEKTVIKDPEAAEYYGEYDDAENSGKGAVESVVITGNRR